MPVGAGTTGTGGGSKYRIPRPIVAEDLQGDIQQSSQLMSRNMENLYRSIKDPSKKFTLEKPSPQMAPVSVSAGSRYDSNDSNVTPQQSSSGASASVPVGNPVTNQRPAVKASVNQRPVAAKARTMKEELQFLKKTSKQQIQKKIIDEEKRLGDIVRNAKKEKANREANPLVDFEPKLKRPGLDEAKKKEEYEDGDEKPTGIAPVDWAGKAGNKVGEWIPQKVGELGQAAGSYLDKQNKNDNVSSSVAKGIDIAQKHTDPYEKALKKDIEPYVKKAAEYLPGEKNQPKTLGDAAAEHAAWMAPAAGWAISKIPHPVAKAAGIGLDIAGKAAATYAATRAANRGDVPSALMNTAMSGGLKLIPGVGKSLNTGANWAVGADVAKDIVYGARNATRKDDQAPTTPKSLGTNIQPNSVDKSQIVPKQNTTTKTSDPFVKKPQN
jgi:hypothetical protein